MWKHAWVNDASQFQTRWEGLRVTSSAGQGFIAQGTRDWQDYEVATTVTPLLAEAWGLAARVQGRERYYALVFDRAEGGRVRLVRRRHDETASAARGFPWSLDQAYALALRVEGSTIRASIDGKAIFEVQDSGSDMLSRRRCRPSGRHRLGVNTGSAGDGAVGDEVRRLDRSAECA